MGLTQFPSKLDLLGFSRKQEHCRRTMQYLHVHNAVKMSFRFKVFNHISKNPIKIMSFTHSSLKKWQFLSKSIYYLRTLNIYHQFLLGIIHSIKKTKYKSLLYHSIRFYPQFHILYSHPVLIPDK